MSAARLPDSARYWRTPLVPDADLLTATYRDHAFAPHWHDAYTIPVILEGAERFTYRGTGYVAETGTVPVINPGEVHTGSRAADEGWCYRVSYMPVEFIRELASTIAGRPQDAPWFAPDVIRDADLAARLTLAHRMLEAGSERALSSQADAAGQPAGDPATGAPRIYDPLAAETAMLDALSTLIVRHADV
ncbi:AraC family ligand binding domain-containing protein, partial [Burkholderia cenocepacia]